MTFHFDRYQINGATIMRPRISLETLAVLVVGGLLGYAAASGQINSLWQAQAATQNNSTGTCTADGADCHSDAFGKGLLLAKADGPETRQLDSGQPAKDGKKPNILVIMGDDIGWFNPSCYNQRNHGLPDPKHRSNRP